MSIAIPASLLCILHRLSSNLNITTHPTMSQARESYGSGGGGYGGGGAAGAPGGRPMHQQAQKFKYICAGECWRISST